MQASILSTGSYLPDRVLTNHDLEKMVDTSDEWITTRSGIKCRRIADAGVSSSDLGVYAAKRAMESGGIKPEEIEMVILSTSAPDFVLPASACCVQANIGAVNAGAFDLLNACNGFINGLDVGGALIASGQYKRVVVVAAEKMSSIINWEDRNTCVLFGDGAGAVVLGCAEEGGHPIIASACKSDGTMWDYAVANAGGSRKPITVEALEQKEHLVTIQGRKLFKAATVKIPEIITEVVEKAGISLKDIACMIPHQMNLRIIESVTKRLEIEREKVFVNIQNYGNTASASIPIALDEASRADVIRSGDLVLLVAFGAGLSWGATVLRW